MKNSIGKKRRRDRKRNEDESGRRNWKRNDRRKKGGEKEIWEKTKIVREKKRMGEKGIES